MLHDGSAPDPVIDAALQSLDVQVDRQPLNEQAPAVCLQPGLGLVLLDRSQGASQSAELLEAVVDVLAGTSAPLLALARDPEHLLETGPALLDAVLLPMPEALLRQRLSLLLRLYRQHRQIISLGQALATRDEQLEVALATRVQAEARSGEAARQDPLTGLPNRALFRDRLDQAVQRADRHGSLMALVVLDVVRFDAVNAAFGLPVADALLQALAGRLRGAVRRSDTVARIGNDAFALIAEDLPDSTAADSTVEKLLEVLELPYPLASDGEEPLLVQARMRSGLALYPFHADNADALLARVSDAIERNKVSAPSG